MHKKSLVFLISLMILIIGCTKTEDPEVVAAFSSNKVYANTGEQIQFTDESAGEPVSWSWIFEGGTPSTSTDRNPLVSYAGAGSFDVLLTVKNEFSEDTLVKEAYITISEVILNVAADFSQDATEASVGSSIRFSDGSTGEPTSWNWTFEGGTPESSQEANPEVTYNAPGIYSVSLSVSNASSSDSITREGLIRVRFSGYTKTTDVIYGNDTEGHRMILYEGAGDTRTDRPVVILMGGGAFEGTNLALLEPLAINLARFGVVAAPIRYRVMDTDDGAVKLISANQDSRTAVRYMRKEAANLGIDPGKIFTGGNGSGAFAALFHAYLDDTDLAPADLEFVNSIGGLEGEEQGNSGYSSEAAGIVSLAGGMYMGLDPITAEDIPIFAVHGSADPEVPYNYSSTGPTYGSKMITDKVRSVGLEGYLFTIIGGGHDAPRLNSDDYIDDLLKFIRTVTE